MAAAVNVKGVRAVGQRGLRTVGLGMAAALADGNEMALGLTRATGMEGRDSRWPATESTSAPNCGRRCRIPF